MPVTKGFSEIDGVTCVVTLYADEDPVMVHVGINGVTPLKLTVIEAVVVREALCQALDLFLDEGDEEETVH